ncbi:hypothetical protein GGR53DRAFT_349775 [Hypoxylon sp. FL1150]|nr:hypothetical protein GGR53DRAFT_349775 [Hypoxylon sp. FL1150]
MPDTADHESPPPATVHSGRIKRNTACTSCRDAKVRCNPSQNPASPCQRCSKLRLSCLVDKTHKRVSRRSKIDELVQEIQSIKQSVNGQSSSLPSQGTGYEPLTFKEPNTQRLGIPSPISVSTAPEVRPPAIASATVAPSSVINTPSIGHSPGADPILPRALGSQPFSGDDIEYYFQKYFENYHPYMPIVQVRDPNKCYESGSLLFWVIIYIASRRYARGPKVLPFLLESIRKDAFAAICIIPLSMSSINALVLLCTWIFPDVRFVNDPTSLFSSVCMNTALQLGIHTGRGAHPEYSHGVFQNSFSDQEASFTWAGYNIIAQRVSSSMGIPPLGGLFNQTVQNIIDGRTPFQVPSTFRVLLECQKFCNHLSKTMVACLEESQGVSPHIVQLLEDEWTAVRGLICSERADELDGFNALLVQLEIQVYYMLPPPGYSPEALKRNVLRTYSTAQAVIRRCLELDDSMSYLRHLPHFHFRTLLAAGCVVYRLLRSSYRDAVDRAAGERSASDAIVACRRATIMDGDLPMRLGNLLESWQERLSYLGDASEPPVSAFSHRLGASVSFDCMTRWRTDHQAYRCRSKEPNSSNCQPIGANVGGPVPAAGAVLQGGETPAMMPGMDLLQNIDWTFMDDFDWNFEPVMPVLGAPT